MKAHELAKRLLDLPNVEVMHIWDGAARTSINFVWEAKNGTISTADYDQVVYDDNDRPIDAPLSKDGNYWSTPTEI